MCDCIELVNKKLQPHNTCLALELSINFSTGKTKYVLPVPTRKIDRRKRKPAMTLFPRFCVFCGEEHADSLVAAAEQERRFTDNEVSGDDLPESGGSNLTASNGVASKP